MNCPKCGKDNGKASSKNGSYCKDCHNNFCRNTNGIRRKHITESSKYKRSIIRNFILKEKTNKHCLDCKIQYPPHVLDFDHVRGVKSVNISVAVNKHWNLDRLKEEIAKCDLVCANCHRIRTFNRENLRPDGPTEKTQSYEL